MNGHTDCGCVEDANWSMHHRGCALNRLVLVAMAAFGSHASAQLMVVGIPFSSATNGELRMSGEAAASLKNRCADNSGLASPHSLVSMCDSVSSGSGESVHEIVVSFSTLAIDVSSPSEFRICDMAGTRHVSEQCITLPRNDAGTEPKVAAR